jgi:hypothetical protein
MGILKEQKTDEVYFNIFNKFQGCYMESKDRKNNGDEGDFRRMWMGCKQKLACYNKKRHNAKQCLKDSNQSVCRQCCEHDDCLKNKNPANMVIGDWKEDIPIPTDPILG